MVIFSITKIAEFSYFVNYFIKVCQNIEVFIGIIHKLLLLTMYPNDILVVKNIYIYYAEEAISCQKLSWVSKLIREAVTH